MRSLPGVRRKPRRWNNAGLHCTLQNIRSAIRPSALPMLETPEQRARQQIDALLVACGWVVQDYKQFNPSAGRGIALREAPLKSGTCDYLLLVDRKAVGVA